MTAYKQLAITIILLFHVQFISYGQQNEGNIWYFGQQAGIDFNSGSPVPLTDGLLATQEGCATICDSLGNLLFYTDGITVWNKNHQGMPNSMPGSLGGALAGNPSSTQSGVIVPRPSFPDHYYIFTVDNNLNPNGCRYSMVDMSLNNGLGDVVLSNKNTYLFTPTSEKIAAIVHENGMDFWVITHPWGSNAFYTYLVTSAGVASTPVISNVGTPYVGYMYVAHGYLKPSPDGSLVCAAIEWNKNLEMFHFNKSNGQLTHFFTSLNYYPGAYGVEFSGDGNVLYSSGRWDTAIYQWDLSTGNATQILNSVQQVGTLSTPMGGALQLAPDGRIYIARYNEPYLAVINNPNELGGGISGCHFQDSAFWLAGKFSNEGLPTFISTFFNPGNFYFSNICIGDTTCFTMADTSIIDSVFWSFGEPSSGNNYSQVLNPTHIYGDTGIYNVSLITYATGQTDTTFRQVKIHAYPEVSLGNDTILCNPAQIQLDAGNTACNFEWNTGATTQTILINPVDTFIYTVQVANNLCISSDSIKITAYHNTPILSVSDLYCYQDTITIDFTGTAGSNASFSWNFDSANVINGSGNGPFTVNWTDTGHYQVSLIISENICQDTIVQTIFNPPGIELEISGSNILCANQGSGSIDLTVNSTYTQHSFLWNNFSTTEDLSGIPAGLYTVTVNYNNAYCNEVISYEILQYPDFTGFISIENLRCYGEANGSMDLFASGGTPPYQYSWSWLNANTEDISGLSPGNYTVTVTDTMNCEYVLSGSIEQPDSLIVEAISNPSLCIGDTVTLSAQATGGTPPYYFIWPGYGNGQNITINPSTSLTFYVQCIDSNLCESNIDSVNIALYPAISGFSTLMDDTICLGDSTSILATFNGGIGQPYTCYINDEVVEVNSYVSPTETTTYFIYGSDACNSPSDTTWLTLEVIPVPDNQLMASDTLGCTPLEVVFSSQLSEDWSSMQWHIEDIEEDFFSTEPEPVHVFEKPGIFDVSLSIVDHFGCNFKFSHQQFIHVLESPVAEFLPENKRASILKPTIFFQNNSYPYVNCHWDFGDGAIYHGHLESVSHTYSDTGTFNVLLIAETREGCLDTSTVPVYISDINDQFYAPNAFNPNSPFSENRFFKPRIYSLDESHYHMTIYDRWGEKIFETFNYNHSWDGKAKEGTMVKIGVYTWLVKYKNLKGDLKEEKGVVLVLDK